MSTEKLIPQIRSASREMIRQFGLLENRFVEIGSTSQCHALVELKAQGAMNLNQLSTVLNLEKSTTSRLVAQLLEEEICCMQLDETDRRNKIISLTKKGLKLVDKINVEAELQVRQALDSMSDQEKSTVAQGLSLYAKALHRSRVRSECNIRKLEKNDMSQLISTIKQVRAEFGFDQNHPTAHLSEQEFNDMYEFFSQKKSNYFVLEYDKEIVGGGGYCPLLDADKDICELRAMYLASNLRGLGLGTLLLQKILQKAKSDGFKKCYLETQDFMQGAHALYQKFGFQKLDKSIGNTGHTWTNSWYIKEL